jgi:hypothetical protein
MRAAMRFELTCIMLALAGITTITGCGGPEAEGFFAGGIEGAECPPGTEANGSCGDPDCGVACTATTTCESDSSGCPAGTVCDSSLGYCMPQPCQASSDCPMGETCDTQSFSQDACSPP